MFPICSHTLLAKQGSNAQFLVTLFWYLIMLLSDCFFRFQLKTYFERASNNNFFHNTNIRRACKHYSTFWLLTSKFNMLCILCVYIYLYTYLYTYELIYIYSSTQGCKAGARKDCKHKIAECASQQLFSLRFLGKEKRIQELNH